MLINEIINDLRNGYEWVNTDYTRDITLYGEANQEVKKVAVCWVATMKVLEEAVEKGVNFIITHENLFYEFSTMPHINILNMVQKKKSLLNKNNICVYRCHDLWDCYPNKGVSDVFAKVLGFSFDKRDVSSYYQVAEIEEITVENLSKHIVNVLKEYGEDGVMVLGDITKNVKRVVIGTGAATNIHEMLKLNPDVMLVADDGVRTYCEGQLALDLDIPLIFINHAACEHPGIISLNEYLNNKYNNIEFVYFDDGFNFHYIN